MTMSTKTDENSLLHCSRVLKYLVSSWSGSHRIVCATLIFFFGAAQELFAGGLRFIGVVKTATQYSEKFSIFS
jgi:hypothetical protein